jgi:hypothetical protein
MLVVEVTYCCDWPIHLPLLQDSDDRLSEIRKLLDYVPSDLHNRLRD